MEMIVHLCKNCIAMLSEYNPYVVQVKVEEVETEDCDNYTIDGKFVNLDD